MENEKIQCENMLMRESLKNIVCPSCGGPPFGEEERRRNIQQLQVENTHLKEEHDKVSNLLAKYVGKPIPQIESLVAANTVGPSSSSSLNLSTAPCIYGRQGMAINSLNTKTGGGDTNDHHIDLLANYFNPSGGPEEMAYQLTGISDIEKSLMIETASSARDELIRLIRIDEPLWTNSKTDQYGNKYVLHHESYEQIFPRRTRFKSPSARIEASKEWAFVPFSGSRLYDMFRDLNKWIDLFPTIVNKAMTIQVIESEIIGNLGGSLQLMHEQMHILSPIVPPQNFYLLRYCQQMEQNLWVILDVSYDWDKENQQHFPPCGSWRHPSGCIIEQLPSGNSKVTWVEHVEVDDQTLRHWHYTDLLKHSFAFGAERWVLTLQRMCERYNYFMEESAPTTGVIIVAEGKRSVMDLAQRMVKYFYASLNASCKNDFPQQSEMNNSGIRVSLRKSVEQGQPSGMVVCASTSLWLPLSARAVFDFFADEKTRHKWDVLSNGNPVQEIAHIAYGAHPEDHISVIRPFVPNENNLMMLQESFIDPLGSVIIYAPIDLPTLNIAINGGDSSGIPILPSGFIISSNSRQRRNSSMGGTAGEASSVDGSGSLLTIAFQILLCSLSSNKQLSMESVATINTLICTTIDRIKSALNFSSLDS